QRIRAAALAAGAGTPRAAVAARVDGGVSCRILRNHAVAPRATDGEWNPVGRRGARRSGPAAADRLESVRQRTEARRTGRPRTEHRDTLWTQVPEHAPVLGGRRPRAGRGIRAHGAHFRAFLQRRTRHGSRTVPGP